MITCYDLSYINPFELREEEITIQLLAHHLARMNRFAGATKKPIPIGQHSVYVSRVVEKLGGSPLIQLQGLIHDGSEALIADIVKWVKESPEFAGYRQLEDSIQAVIYKKFGCPLEMDPLVEQADRLMVRVEALRGYPVYPFTHPRYPKPTKEEIAFVGKWQPWNYKRSEELFLERFHSISRSL